MPATRNLSSSSLSAAAPVERARVQPAQRRVDALCRLRLLYIVEDCVWTTFHPTTETDPEKVVKEVTLERRVPELREGGAT